MAVRGHRVFMPPKFPKVPKGPVLPDFRTKAKRPAPATVRLCKGGPWDGKSVKMSLAIGESSLVLRVDEFHGSYIKTAIGLEWRDAV